VKKRCIKRKMKVLFVGEIVAGAGRKTVKQVLPDLLKEHSPDLVLSNVENLSGGRGITPEKVNEMLDAGINYCTGGDHIFWERGTEDFIDSLPIVRPANYPGEVAGRGYTVIDLGKKGQVLLVNLMGRTSVNSTTSYLEDPFRKIDEILELHKDIDLAATIVDFHCDYTSEKVAFGHYIDGRVTAVIGTHTHVPTADTMILPKGTFYVTDVGMTGIIDGVLGVKKENIINLFLTARNQRFEWETAGRRAFRSVLFDTDKKEIIRIDKEIS